MYDKNLKKASTNGPKISITCISNIYVRMMEFEDAGTVEVGHAHPYDHATMVTAGSLEVQVYDEKIKELLPPVKYKAPSLIFIKKELVHQLVSLEKNTIVLCIHALRDENSQIISPEMIPVPTSLMDTIKLFDNAGISIEGMTLEKEFDEIDSYRIKRPFSTHEVSS